jgi:hypothetical protein
VLGAIGGNSSGGTATIQTAISDSKKEIQALEELNRELFLELNQLRSEKVPNTRFIFFPASTVL